MALIKKAPIPILNGTRADCAHEKIRTSTPEGTTPSKWRVYQFHHVRG